MLGNNHTKPQYDEVLNVHFMVCTDMPSTFFWWLLAFYSKHFYRFATAEANSADDSKPHATTPHPVQPYPAHGYLRWLLSFGTNPACLPQLSTTHAGEGPRHQTEDCLFALLLLHFTLCWELSLSSMWLITMGWIKIWFRHSFSPRDEFEKLWCSLNFYHLQLNI